MSTYLLIKVDKVLKKRGFIESAVVYRWTSIVGKELSDGAILHVFRSPGTRLGATIFLDVLGARSLEISNFRDYLIFGYAAVKNISIDRCTV